MRPGSSERSATYASITAGGTARPPSATAESTAPGRSGAGSAQATRKGTQTARRTFTNPIEPQRLETLPAPAPTSTPAPSVEQPREDLQQRRDHAARRIARD